MRRVFVPLDNPYLCELSAVSRDVYGKEGMQVVRVGLAPKGTYVDEG